jgi:hypothetical protein
MADINVVNLAAAIINDKRYSELKTAIYEDLVKSDHASVVAVFKALQEYASDAEDNTFYAVDKPKLIQSKVGSHDLDIDPDLDDTLTEEEVSLRK